MVRKRATQFAEVCRGKPKLSQYLSAHHRFQLRKRATTQHLNYAVPPNVPNILPLFRVSNTQPSKNKQGKLGRTRLKKAHNLLPHEKTNYLQQMFVCGHEEKNIKRGCFDLETFRNKFPRDNYPTIGDKKLG